MSGPWTLVKLSENDSAPGSTPPVKLLIVTSVKVHFWPLLSVMEEL